MRNFIDSTFFSFLFPLALVVMILLGYYLTSVYVKKKNQSWVNSGAEASVISFFCPVDFFHVAYFQ